MMSRARGHLKAIVFFYKFISRKVNKENYETKMDIKHFT